MRALAVLLLVCSCSATPIAPADAGAPDSGTPADAGAPLDAGSADAGNADSGTPDAGSRDAGTPFYLSISGLDAGAGFFDVAPERDDAGTVWMSYSAVTNDLQYPSLRRVETHLARSDDNGLSWDERQVINPAMTVPISGQPFDGGIWIHEVSRLRLDPFASNADERWVVLWHRYLILPPPVPAAQSGQFQDGWLGLKTAPSPDGPWSAEQKLLVGAGYDTADDAIDGPAEISATGISSALSDCAAFTEPALLAQADGWVIAISCVSATTSRIVFLHRDRTAHAWTYLGTVLPASMAMALGFDHFTAPELVTVGGRTVLIASPEVGGIYKGCDAYEVTSLDPPVVASTPTWTLGIGDSDLGFAGACGYVDGLATGALEGVLFSGPGGLPEFREYATLQGL